MDSKVMEIKKLLIMNPFSLKNKGRIPLTKVSKSFKIVPAQVKAKYGSPILRYGKSCYIFKSNRTTSHLIISGAFGCTLSFWDIDQPSTLVVTCSSQKLINEFIVQLKSNNISVSE